MKKKRIICLVTMMSLSLLAGCGSAADKYATTSSFVTNNMVDMEPAEAMKDMSFYGSENEYFEEEAVDIANGNEVVAQSTNRKLIKNVDLEVETKQFDSLMSGITKQVEDIGGYIENMEKYNGGYYNSYRGNRYANLVIRIPQSKLNMFLESISEACNVVRRNERVDDVTLKYVDLASRRDTLNVEKTRLLELMEQAESIEDIITIEDRLTNIRYEIESMESQLRTMDNQVDYSTVDLNISEVEELTPVEEESFWERISNGFVDSLESVGEGFVSVIEWFIVNLPILVVWGVIIAVVVLVIKKIIKKKNNKVAVTDKESKEK